MIFFRLSPFTLSIGLALLLGAVVDGDAEPTQEKVPGGATVNQTPSHNAEVPPVENGRAEMIGLQKLGLSLTERRDWAAAEIAFREILVSRRAEAADLASALLGLARVYRRAGSLIKAAASYERYLKDYPANEHVPEALLELGRTQRTLGAHQLAIARFYSVINSTLKLSEGGFTNYQVLAKTAQFEIAETHFQQGNYAEANKFFTRLRLLDLAPADRARAHFKSAYALYLGADPQGAVQTLRSYLEQWPQDENGPEARYLLSLSLRALGQKQAALDATLELLRTQQASGDAKLWSYWQRRTGNQLANDFFQSGDTQNALMIYQSLAALSAEPAWQLPIIYQIGLCYERLRMIKNAITAYERIVAYTAAGVNAAGAGPTEATRSVAPELSELARMAAWRLSQLNWQNQIDSQLTDIFTPAPAAPGLTSAPQRASDNPAPTVPLQP
jgi:TolA-binding protein